MKNISTVAIRLFKLGADYLTNALYKLLGLIFYINKWIVFIILPSNSIPDSEFYVIGDKLFQIIFSQIFDEINNDIPDPKPQPF